MLKLIFIFIWITLSGVVRAEVDTDQWEDSEKTYRDLIDEGFEVKAYDTITIEIEEGLIILFFVTVLQKNKEVFECQEYQTLDTNMKTLDMTIMCRRLIQPYQRGVGT